MTSVPLRRNRDFVALWTGQTASALGTSISSLAYPLLVLVVTGSTALAGLVGTVTAAATFVLRIPAGAIADRVDRKRLMLVCDGGRSLAVGSLGVAVLVGQVTVVHVVVVALSEATFGVLFAPAEAVAVRRVVAADQVREAVAVNQSRQQLAGLVGPLLGGALFGLNRALPFLADAASYLVSFVAVLSIRRPLRDAEGPASPARQPLRRELTEGLRWLWRQPFLRFTTVWLSAVGLLFTSLGLVTVVLATQLDAAPAQIGAAFTITGAGGLVGALLAPWLLRTLSARTIVVGYAWIATVATFLLLLVDSFWTLGLVGALAFLAVPAVNSVVLAQIAIDAPDRLQGRAVSAATQLTTLFHPLGPVTVGVILELAGTGPTIVGYGIAFVALAAVVSVSPAVRRGPAG